jgi:16S rRNA (guanine527-N7)-methyltransferase
VERALALSTVPDQPPGLAVDLGAGGGVPGLVLATLAWPQARWLLVESAVNRAQFLLCARDRLGLSHRVAIAAERAEVAGRGSWRHAADLVVARGFGPPAVTAECAAPFLRPGGALISTEPPCGRPERWEPSGLALLGMAIGPTISRPTSLQVLRQVTACPERYPRRVGVPTKRPLF